MSSGAVPIRQIDQSVATPSFDVAPNPARAVPMESTAGPALQEAGKGLMGIWQAQQQHQNALDIADRMGNYQDQFGQVKTDLLNSGMSAKDMVTNLQTSAAELRDAYVNNPANKSIAPQLALLMRQHVADQMQSFPAEATERVFHDLDFKARVQVKQAAQDAAAGYRVSGPPGSQTVADSPDVGGGADRTQEAYASINGMYPLPARAPENALFKQQFDHEKAFQRAMLVAQNNPAALNAYLSSPDGRMLDAEEHTAVSNARLGTLRSHAEIVNAGEAEDRAQTIDKLDQLQQAHDPSLPSATATAVKSGWIDNREARHYVPGFEGLDNQPMVKDFEERIKSDPTSVNPSEFITDQITSTTRGRLKADLAFSLKQEKTAVGQANKIVRRQVYDAMTPTDPATLRFADDRKKAEELRDQAMGQYESGLMDAKSGADVYKLRDEILKQFKGTAFTPPPLPSTMPPPAIPSAADKIRKAGLGS